MTRPSVPLLLVPIALGVVLVCVLSVPAGGQQSSGPQLAETQSVSASLLDTELVRLLQAEIVVTEQGNTVRLNATVSRQNLSRIQALADRQNTSAANILSIKVLQTDLGFYANRTVVVSETNSTATVSFTYRGLTLNDHPQYRGTVANGTVNVQIVSPIRASSREAVSRANYSLTLPGEIVATNADYTSGNTAVWADGTVPAVIAARSEFGQASSVPVETPGTNTSTAQSSQPQSQQNSGGVPLAVIVFGALVLTSTLVAVPWAAYRNLTD